ncbi:hypothetical protein ACWFRF_20725 [Nocardia sp. NPDC055165]
MADLTARQTEELAALLALAQEHGVDIDDVSAFVIGYQPEERPGRGHDIRVAYVDGEHAISAYIDVYGRTTVGIGAVDWLHREGDDGDDECELCNPVELPDVHRDGRPIRTVYLPEMETEHV